MPQRKMIWESVPLKSAKVVLGNLGVAWCFQSTWRFGDTLRLTQWRWGNAWWGTQSLSVIWMLGAPIA